jgi:hypothetical protein
MTWFNRLIAAIAFLALGAASIPAHAQNTLTTQLAQGVENVYI